MDVKVIGMHNKEYRPTLAQLRTFVTIAEAADAFHAHARGAHGTLTGPLTIGVIPTIAPYILPTLLRSITETYPELEPRFVEEQTEHLLGKLRDGQLDLAIIALPSEAAGMVDVPLYTEDFVVVTDNNDALAGREDLTPAELDSLKLLLLDDGHCLRDQILDLCRRAHINASEATNSVTRASSLTTILQLVMGGLGATLVPESAIGAEEFRKFGALVTAAFEEALQRSRNV